jgi:hypothetical protein
MSGTVPAARPNDPYAGLRSGNAMGGKDACHCDHVKGVVLRHVLDANPLGCLRCNCMVAPERIALDPGLVEAMVHWNSLYEALYLLWLDSDEYEAWAAERLADREGRVNRLGRELVAAMADRIPANYWWFEPEPREQPGGPCPLCQRPLRASTRIPVALCETCRIVL